MTFIVVYSENEVEVIYIDEDGENALTLGKGYEISYIEPGVDVSVIYTRKKNDKRDR